MPKQLDLLRREIQSHQSDVEALCDKQLGDLVKSNNISHVEARSSLVGLCGSGWGHIQQAAPLEVDIKWVSKSLTWLWSTAQ